MNLKVIGTTWSDTDGTHHIVTPEGVKSYDNTPEDSEELVKEKKFIETYLKSSWNGNKIDA